ncbi:unnamed protein product [Schistosoma mattheei]|uniref:Uncharacterized protein n=1 Tax=Schistosoma mattheei TaxID=31246 RepID=A0A183Q2S9_9TREM|nr:unnamed protein product [Schistosoma mattheei]
MQEKTNSVAAASATVGLNIHKGESKILRYNTACTNLIKTDGDDLESVKTYTYLGSIIDEQGGSGADVKARIGKARAAYSQMKNIWNSKQLSTNTKLSTQNTSDPLARHYQQQPHMKDNKPDSSGGRNLEEELEVDRTHIEESTELRHKTSPHMESSRPKEKRNTKEHITPGNGDRREKNEQELDGTRKEGGGQNILPSVDCDFARAYVCSVIPLVLFWQDLGIPLIPRDRQQIYLAPTSNRLLIPVTQPSCSGDYCQPRVDATLQAD